MNDYSEKIILDKKKSKDLDAGKRLAGQVTQEFDLEKEFIKTLVFIFANIIKYSSQSSQKNWL